MILNNIKRKIIRLFHDLEQTQKQCSEIENRIKKKENYLRKANTIKDALECELQEDRKKYKKLKEILKVFIV